jgi:hypothetical protein
MKLLLCAYLVGIGLYSYGAAWGNESIDTVMKAEDVRHLIVGQAEHDAKSAMARGNRRLLAIYGLTLEVPGVGDDVSKLRSKYGLRILQGTSDAIKDAQDRQTNLNARKYALQPARFGLATVESAIADAIAPENAAALETLLEADYSLAQVTAAIERVTSTANTA